MSRRICDFIAASFGLADERVLDLLLERLEAGDLGALLLGLQRLDVEDLALGRRRRLP